MQTLQAAITGAIQGLSEFLPISSSAHIVFSTKLYTLISGHELANVANQEEIFFDIIVHLATLFAVVIYFFKDLKEIFKNSFCAIKEKDYQNKDLKLILLIALSVVITGIIGLVLKSPVEGLLANPKLICIMLFITGLVLLLSEKMYKGNKEISLKSTILISIAQGLAVVPGFSRSGFTIATALFCGMDRVKAARFSFLMSIPVILLASMVYPMLELDFGQIMSFNLKAIFIGFLVSFVVGYLCIKYFMQLLGKISLRAFGYYCLVVSIGLFILFQVVYHL